MDTSPILSRIWIYPIKSLDGVSVDSAVITPGGSLAMDREFALVDEAGKFVNAKRTAKIHQVRSQFKLPQRQVTLSCPGQNPQTFHLDGDREAMGHWFSEFFGFGVKLIQDCNTGFPDDLKASGPTIISEATLTTTASWFEGMTVDEMRSRLRTNLEVSGVPSFWEDRLFSAPLIETGFKIGDVVVRGSNPCQRCVVPTRDQRTGKSWPGFQKTLVQKRQATLPHWSDPQSFNHYYRLAVNTRISDSEQGKVVSIGSEIE